jgi:hypothetical protein
MMMVMSTEQVASTGNATDLHLGGGCAFRISAGTPNILSEVFHYLNLYFSLKKGRRIS